MVNEYAITTRQDSWIKWLARICDMKPKSIKVYDYSRAIHGVDYIFGRLNERDSRGYMTAQRRGVKVGDYVLLMQDGRLLFVS